MPAYLRGHPESRKKMSSTVYSFDYFKKSADYVKEKSGGFTPEIGMILGTGLGAYADRIDAVCTISYEDIPNFLVSKAPGHEGKLILGTVEGKKVACLSGRFHSYDGYDFEELTIPVRLLKLLGIKTLIVTNAAGAVNKEYNVGDVMIISDQIKLNGPSPLKGPNIEEFGPRFFDVSNMYDKKLRALAREAAEGTGLTLREGVYFFMPGPQYETPAEIKAARMLGGDAVGMSTVTETLTAAHCGIPVLGLSLITNMAAGVLDTPLDGDHVIEAGKRSAALLEVYFGNILRRL